MENDEWLRINDQITSASHTAYQVLREGILACRLEPGTRISVAELALKMGVSRTPVRDALQRLEAEGLVVTVPRSHTRVAELSMTEMDQLYAIRFMLEVPAAGLAAQNITAAQLHRLQELVAEAEVLLRSADDGALLENNHQFHRTLYEASGNQRLSALMADLRARCQRYIITFLHAPGRNREIVAEHKLILEALAARDATRVQSLVETHQMKPWVWLKQQLTKKEGSAGSQ